jgi:hypothetical protein
MSTKPAFESTAHAGRRWLETLHAATPVTFGDIAVMPLRTVAPVDPPWLLLSEALAGASVEVSEIGDQGTVPTIHIANRGVQDVLLLDGEELIGAKQNRVLNTAVLVRARSTLEVPVSCVEQGRWSYRTRRFSPSAHSLYASLRLKKAAWVHESLRAGRTHQSDQIGTWIDLKAKAAALSVKSSTMAGAFMAHGSDLDEYTRALAPIPDQVGALVYVRGTWWGMDVLSGPRLFAAGWPRLLSGYVLDALCGSAERRPGEPSLEPLQALLATAVETFAAVGPGEDCRFSSPHIVGAALVVDGIVAHATAFPAPSQARDA